MTYRLRKQPFRGSNSPHLPVVYTFFPEQFNLPEKISLNPLAFKTYPTGYYCEKSLMRFSRGHTECFSPEYVNP
jgi:hypothetical protein